MTSLVSWLMTGLTPLLLSGRAGDAPVTRGLAARVAARIADAWRVPVEQVRLSWGHSSGTGSPADDTTFRVLGRGDDGWFVVVFDPAASTAMAVRVRAGIECPVMVAARSLPAGSRLSDGDLRILFGHGPGENPIGQSDAVGKHMNALDRLGNGVVIGVAARCREPELFGGGQRRRHQPAMIVVEPGERPGHIGFTMPLCPLCR